MVPAPLPAAGRRPPGGRGGRRRASLLPAARVVVGDFRVPRRVALLLAGLAIRASPAMDFLVGLRRGVLMCCLALHPGLLKAGLALRPDSLLTRLPRPSADRTEYRDAMVRGGRAERDMRQVLDRRGQRSGSGDGAPQSGYACREGQREPCQTAEPGHGSWPRTGAAGAG